MSDTERTAADVLAAESDPNQQPPTIEFTLTDAGRAEIIVVPTPTPVKTWLWALQNCFVALNPSLGMAGETDERRLGEMLVDGLILKRQELLSVATGLSSARLALAEDAEVKRASGMLVEQMGGEMRDAGPFSDCTFQDAQEAYLLKLRMLILPGRSDGTGQRSPSAPNTAGLGTT